MNDLGDQTALLDSLTDKQREVLGLVSEGLTSKEIARKLGISESAVNQRIEVVRMRLGGRSRASIARLYRDTNTMILTIPTSNNLTGKAMQLHDGDPIKQQSPSEGANGLAAFDDKSRGVLQPSTLPPWLTGTSNSARRLAVAVFVAIGLLAIAILVIALANAMREIGIVR